MKNNTETTKNSKIIPLFFNISHIRQSVGDYNLLTSADLRMLIKQTTIATEQRVELYRGRGTSARYLASRFVTNKWRDKWLSFDVTETLQEWLKGAGELNYLMKWTYLLLFSFDSVQHPQKGLFWISLFGRGWAGFRTSAVLWMQPNECRKWFQFFHLWDRKW